MADWDALLTKPGERILVLVATNRSFDLDDAIIRRFQRRVMVGLLSVENREIILRPLLVKEKVGAFDYKELATFTEGYNGSDLKERKNKAKASSSKVASDLKENKEESKEEGKIENNEEANKEGKVITLRPLHGRHEACQKISYMVAASIRGSIMSELKQWYNLYREGGSRKKEHIVASWRLLKPSVMEMYN